jgi:hypothetical protein
LLIDCFGLLGWRLAGTHVSTGEEVGIKLGGAPKATDAGPLLA